MKNHPGWVGDEGVPAKCADSRVPSAEALIQQALKQCILAAPFPLGDLNAGGGWVTLRVLTGVGKRIHSLEADSLTGCVALSESFPLRPSFLRWGGDAFTELLGFK